MGLIQDFEITEKCNNYCPFCSSEGLAERNSIEKIKYSIMRAKEKKISRVDISGGEPTISPYLFEILNFCKRLNFETIYIKTNGRKLKDFDFAKRMVNCGANSFLVSLHGHNDEVHDNSSGIPGSFRETMQGLNNLSKLGVDFTTLTVINKANYNYLPEIAEFAFDNFNLDEHNFAFTYPVARAEKNFDDVVPHYRETGPYFLAAAEIVMKRGKFATFDNVPLCYLPGIESYANFLNKNDPSHSYHDYGTKCKECIYFPICEGVPPRYIFKRGWDEFEPVKEPGLPSNIEIPAAVDLNENMKCTPSSTYANKIWGAVLITNRIGILPLTPKGYNVYKASCDGRTTLKEIKEKFGEESLGFLYTLKLRNFIEFVTIETKQLAAKPEPIAFIARKNLGQVWYREAPKRNEDDLEFPLYRKRPEYPKVNLISSASLKKAAAE